MGRVTVRGASARELAVRILQSGGSLEDAAAATGYGRDYVRQLGAKAGIRFRRPDNTEALIELYKDGKTAKEAAEIVGVSRATVYNAWHSAGLQKRLTQLQQEVKDLRDRGKVCSEIAEAIGIHASQVSAIASAIGMPFSEEEKKRSIRMALDKAHKTQHGSEEDRRAKAEEFVRHNYPGWIYLDGFIGSSDSVRLMCEACGSETERSAITIRHKTAISCALCAKKAREKRTEEEKAARKAARKSAKREKEARRFWSQNFTQISFKHCKECGAVYLGGGCFCSDKCRKKHTNRKHDNRLSRAEVVDRSITLEKLFKRDGGICWICGEPCDYGDGRKDKSGNFIVGPSYPSIDHVYPLSHGGAHTWQNVRLAHHRCNTLKSDKVVV